ncbi:WD40 domain containing protein [Pyrrhoderma noxium]|uniref:WD40 domain containing protein n=1 Tax=Pyrrhoderma noxium TaxID=2282107 RepID=A0A286UT16_9AGAM|nr:WD40 domain containing protein [Pyrrhoderma noxium]
MSSSDSTLPSSPPRNPPPYSPPTSGAQVNFGFPPGYFVIRSVATGRLLDVEFDSVEDGSGVILWPEKESSLVEGFRMPEADNQVFFIDTAGALCSRHSGHAIDIEDGRLVLRHRRPVLHPYPNAFSHPLPQFWYSSSTKQIFIRFQCDPSYSQSSTSNAWRQRSYLLSSVPLRRPRTILDDASDAITSVFAGPLSPITSIFGASARSSTVQEVYNSDIDLREDEVLEEDRGEGEEVDDSPELRRDVRVIAVGEHETGLTELTKRRRAWEVLPLRRTRVNYQR